jgi:endonuclease/exonuclease/phosphatase family metal-dependent hydrolase
VALVALAGCGGLGPPQPWIDADAIEGELRPEVARDGAPPPPPSARLRVVCWNVHFGADVDALADGLGHPDLAGADLILVQEIEAYPDEDGSRASRLAARLEMNFVYAPARREGSGTHGLALFSRHPLAAVRVMELPHADVAINERRRVALGADMLVDGAPIRVVDVHLDTRLGIADRMAQLHPAVIDLGEPAIVGGDLNTLPYSWLAGLGPSAPAHVATDLEAAGAIDEMMAALGFAAPTSTLGPTDDFPIVAWRLDSIYAAGSEVTGAEVVDSVSASDHVPVRVDLVR